MTIGAVEASHVSIISDLEIRAATPPLAAGHHAVEILGGDVTFTSSVGLEVMADQVFSTTSYSTSGAKSRLIFDKQRPSIYVMNTTSDTLECYQYQSGTTWKRGGLSLSGLTDAALSSDGKTLVLIDGSSFYEVDPAAAIMALSTGLSAPLGVFHSTAG